MEVAKENLPKDGTKREKKWGESPSKKKTQAKK